MSILRSKGGLSTEAAKTLSYIEYNPESNQIESTREIQTTLNSFYLGDQHKMSSGAENIFFTNLKSDINWFPVWSGIKDQTVVQNQGDTGILPATIRTYDDMLSVEPYGAAHASAVVDYYKPAIMADNHSVYGQTMLAGEAVAATDWLIYEVYYGTDDTGIEAYEQKFTGIEYAVGDTIDWWFTHPIEGHNGTQILTTIRKAAGGEDGVRTNLKVRASAGDVNTHYSNIRLRPFVNTGLMVGVINVTTYAEPIRNALYSVDTTSGACVMYPVFSEPNGFTEFEVHDAVGNFSTNNCVVNFGGSTIATLATNGDHFKFYKDGSKIRYINLGNNADTGIDGVV